MRPLIFSLTLCLAAFTSRADYKDTTGKTVWGFPITSYMMPVNDSTKIVQIVLPANIHFEQGKELGLLRGVARGANVDTGSKGWGRCHLIKSQYNYFAVHLVKGKAPVAGDLVYTYIPRSAVGYRSPVFYCASHAVTFTDVEGKEFYKPEDFLKKRTKAQDEALEALMVADVQRTGKYFLENDNSMNKLIEDGDYKGSKVLDVMTQTTAGDVTKFLRYVAARPRRYAGNQWKVSETFATWLMAGAPTVVAAADN